VEIQIPDIQKPDKLVSGFQMVGHLVFNHFKSELEEEMSLGWTFLK
jgi:hypothetical protein